MTIVLTMVTTMSAVLKFPPPLVIGLAILTVIAVVDLVLELTPIRAWPLWGKVGANAGPTGLILFLVWGHLMDAVYPPPPVINLFGVSMWLNGRDTDVLLKISVVNPGEATSLGNWLVTATVDGLPNVPLEYTEINDPVIRCGREKEYYNTQSEDASLRVNVPAHYMAFYYILRRLSSLPPNNIDASSLHVKFSDLISRKPYDAISSPNIQNSCWSIPGLGVSHVVR